MALKTPPKKSGAKPGKKPAKAKSKAKVKAKAPARRTLVRVASVNGAKSPSPNGKPTVFPFKHVPTADELKRHYRIMVLSRRLDERYMKLFRQGRFHGNVFPGVGEGRRVDPQPVAEDGQEERLDIVGGHVVAPVEQGAGGGDALQGERAAY